MGILITFFLLALFLSFLCSLMESVLLSVSVTYVGLLEKEGRAGGKHLHSLKRNINKPLTAILTINTVANTVGATVVGAQIHRLYGGGFVALGSGILTFSILVFSEIIPKTIGAVYWKALAIPSAHIIRGLIMITWPFVYMSEFLSHLIKPKEEQQKVSREEMLMMAEMGEDEGTLQEQESEIIENLLNLRDVKASEVLTPRTVVFAVEASETVGEVITKYSPIAFSRIPVFEGDLDNIIGLVHRYTIINKQAEDHFNVTMKELVMPIQTVHESESVARVLDTFVKLRQHIFLVVDDFGSTAGIITLEDAIETLLGVEIVDEHDAVVDMRKLAKERWHRMKKERQA